MKRYALSLLGLAALPALAHAAVDSTSIAQLAARFHAEERFNGALLVAHGDEVIYEGGWGDADRTWGIPNTAETVFLVGSVSKQFTSMLVLQLAAEGRLGLQDPLSKYLPDYPEDKAGITIHQLLCHSSGLPHYGGIAMIGVDLGDYLRLDRSIASYVELIGRTGLQFEPGARHSYSSLGYIVLGHIAELITGKSFERLMKERIAAPLGVDDLGFSDEDRPVARLAHGYEYNILRDPDGSLELAYVPEPYRDQSNKYGTGGVHASVRALFRWARAVVGDELLDPDVRDKMWTPQAENYGYGWRIDAGDEWGLPEEVEVISHGGSLSGYRASILILDRGRYTVVALGNSDSSRSSALAQGAAQLLHDIEPDPANILGTAVAWRMVRDGVDVAEAFFRRQKEAGFPDYFNNAFAFAAYSERFLDHRRPDLGLALAGLGLEAHPESAELHLASAESLRALGDPESALAAAEKTLALLTAAGEEMSGAATHARSLIAELEAETRQRAAGM